jgi:hypothetical protein
VIREELNRRLDDGETAEKILTWVNAEPKGRAVLEEQFAGAPINKQNLSDWRQGGHQDWLRHREACELVSQMRERAEDLNAEAGDAAVSDRLAAVLAVELAATAQRLLTETTDPAERWQRLQEVMSQLGRLRREDHRLMRLQEQKRAQRGKEERQRAEDRAAREKLEARRNLLAPFQALMAVAKFEDELDGAGGKRMAKPFEAKKEGKPKAHESKAEPAETAPPVKVSQGESSLDGQNGGGEEAKAGEAPAAVEGLEKPGPVVENREGRVQEAG